MQRKSRKCVKILALEGVLMYIKESKEQLMFKDFYLPFGGRLDVKNRWIQLANLIPWDDFEEEYAKNFSEDNIGAPAKPFRMALGSEIIKRKLDISDEEVVEQIRENPYLQYFIGLESYRNESPFDASMMTHFRKRLNLDLLNSLNDKIIENENKKKELKKTELSGIVKEIENSGQLLLDATCIPQDIRYPTDLSLLNEAREKTELIIDKLHIANENKVKKPRTYRKLARKSYLSIAKQRKKNKRVVRNGIKKQLGYIRRNLKIIENQSKVVNTVCLSSRDLRNLSVCKDVFRQQEEMYTNKSVRIDNRIVSISQPYVRPIVRGKAGVDVEFDSKLMISVICGYCRIEKLSWDNYNECVFLKSSVERFKEYYGCYPASVLVDKIFRTRENINYCKEHCIRLSGAALGRPSKDVDKSLESRKQIIQDGRDRIPVEGKFGNCKRKYGLNHIYAKRKDTSECEIAMGILLLNLCKVQRAYIFVICIIIIIPIIQHIKRFLENQTHFFRKL